MRGGIVTNETQEIEWKVATDEESQWIVELGEMWEERTQLGWNFVRKLQAGIDAFGKRRDKSELYDLVSNQTGQSVKTLMNLASLARNPNSALAEELGLDYTHADSVRSLDYEEAASLLTRAAEQSLTVASLGAIIRESRHANSVAPNLPANGNEQDQRPINDDMHDDVPFAPVAGNVLYESDGIDAQADAFAGSASGYEYGEDDIILLPDEFADLLVRAAENLRKHVKLGNSWCNPRGQREWVKTLEGLMY